MRTGPPQAADVLRVGVVGAGFVAQVVHLPHLRDAGGRFHVVAVAEPDAGVREAVAAHYGVRAFASHEELLAEAACDAVLVCSPNATHADVVVAALEAGRHVLVEKPLCLSLEDADRIVAARDRAGLVVQVAYMKRFDPAYEALLEDLVAGGDELAYVSTVTVDPGLAEHFGPYVAPAGAARPSGDGDRLLSDAFMGALVHDVNAVHGLLGALGVRCDEALVVDGFGHPDGSLAGGTTVLGGGLRWTMAWTHLPHAGTFDERIELLGSHGVRRLEFPAPYLRQSPTAYTWMRRGPQGCVQRTFRSWRESYARQLEHFHACVTDGVACRTPPEQARADIGLLAAMHDATLLVAA